MTPTAPEIILAPCELCAGVRNHDVLHKVEVALAGEDADDNDIYKTIQCRGCNTVSVEKTVAPKPPATDKQVEYYPPRMTRRIPTWFSTLEPELQDLLTEVYNALRYGHNRLVAMGIRTVIDYVIRIKVGDQGSFDAGLSRLADEGIIGKQQRDALETVIDTGSAASHRGYKPSIGHINFAVDVTEMILNQLCIAGPMIDHLRKQIPPRPPRV